MDLQSIATESQTLRSTIRDLRSVIATDKERLERHEGELKAALLRLDELENDAQLAFAAIRAPAQGEQAPGFADFGEPEQVAAE
jgi:hypothetical protein